MTCVQPWQLQWTSPFLASFILCVYGKQLGLHWGVHVQPQMESAYEVELAHDKKGTVYAWDFTENKGKQPIQPKKVKYCILQLLHFTTITCCNYQCAITYLLCKALLYHNLPICQIIYQNIQEVFSIQENLQNMQTSGLLSALPGQQLDNSGRRGGFIYTLWINVLGICTYMRKSAPHVTKDLLQWPHKQLFINCDLCKLLTQDQPKVSCKTVTLQGFSQF